jgi:hypothetical protein
MESKELHDRRTNLDTSRIKLVRSKLQIRVRLCWKGERVYKASADEAFAIWVAIALVSGKQVNVTRTSLRDCVKSLQRPVRMNELTRPDTPFQRLCEKASGASSRQSAGH